MGIGKHFRPSTDKANERNYKKIPKFYCQCSGSSQITFQDDINYHQFLSLYQVKTRGTKTVLIIYNTVNKNEEVKDLGYQIFLDDSTCITQLPNGELFCYGGCRGSGITSIIDRSYRVRMLPSGTYCYRSSALYFGNNIYCFGVYPALIDPLTLFRKFDLIKNRWIYLASLPERDDDCHSVIFNGNILISGYQCKNLWFYSVEIDSFSIIPYDFAKHKWKFLINVKRLYLIEWHEEGGLIYESEDEYCWKPISKSGQLFSGYQMYCLYNKEKIYISFGDYYYQFDLKKKVVSKIKEILYNINIFRN